VTQQGAYAYPVPIGNPRFRAESRLRKKEEEEEEEEEVFQERERRSSIFHLAEKPDAYLETSHPLAISCAVRLLRPLRHIPVYDRRFQGNLRTPFITGTGTIALDPTFGSFTLLDLNSN
jgi:hypothetical protein